MEVVTKQTLHIPAVPCSLPVKCHPEYVSLCSASNKWALERLLGVCGTHEHARKCEEWRVPFSFCLAVPEAELCTKSTLLHCCNWTWTAAVLDDMFDSPGICKSQSRAEKLSSRILQACNVEINGYLSVRDPSPEHVLVEFSKVMRELGSRMPASMFQRLVKTHSNWLAASVEQVRRHALRQAPLSLAEYAEYRRYTIFVEPFFVLVELCMDVKLEDEDLSRLEQSGIFTAILDYAFLLNDLLSVKQDAAHPEQVFTVPFLLLRNNVERSLQAALETSTALLGEKEADIIQLHNSLVRDATDQGRDQLLKYLNSLIYVASGCYYWHHVSARYK